MTTVYCKALKSLTVMDMNLFLGKGDVHEFDIERANKLVEAGYLEIVTEEPVLSSEEEEEETSWEESEE